MSAQTYATLGPKLLAQGFEPIPVVGKGQLPDGKSGLFKDWQTMSLHPEQVQYWASNGKGHLNVGLRTAALAPIDVDIYDAEVATRVVTSLLARFGDAPQRIGQAPKALLVYAAQAPGTKITSPIWISPNGKENRVEVLGIGQQFVAFGTHPDTKKPYTWVGKSIADLDVWELPTVDRESIAEWILDELPALIPADWVKKREMSGGGGGDADNPFDAIKPRHEDVDLDALKWMLERLPQDHCDDRNTWRDAIFAVHHQFHDTEQEQDALDLVDAWSAKSHKYAGGAVPLIWKEAKEERSGGLVTIGTIKNWLGPDKWAGYRAQRKAEASVAVVEEQGWEARIAAADRLALEGQIIPEIKGAELSEMVRIDLAGRISARARALGLSLTKAEAKRLIAPPRAHVTLEDPEEAIDIDDWASTAPEWAKEWVWIRTEGKWLHRRTKLLVTKTAFDTELQRHVGDLRVQEGDELIIYQASERMFQHWGAKAVDKEGFHPALGEIFQIGGVHYVNKYRPELRVQSAATWTDEGRQMETALNRHLTLLVPDRKSRQHLRAWLAHQYLYPGVKVRWAPLIKGCPGDGKSLLGEMLELVLGADNVKLMNADTIQTSPFSGWVEGQCVTVFEEVKFHGHNRYDVVNKLKPYIANNRVEKHSKGKDPGNVLNVTNYLMLTNHEDAIPIEEGDRRYFVLFSPFRVLAIMDQLLQADYLITVAEHFEELFSLVRANPGQLALWLAETEFPEDWDPNMSAPMTEAKRVMVANSRSNLEERILEVLDDVAAGTKVIGVGPDVVRLASLEAVVQHLIPKPTAINSQTLTRCLHERGYRPLPGGQDGRARKVQWQGTQRPVWSKDGVSFSNEQVCQLLDQTAAPFDG